MIAGNEIGYSIDEFCQKAGFSKKAYHERWKRGSAPPKVLTVIGGHKRVLVPKEDAQRWLAQRELRRVRREVSREFRAANRIGRRA